MNTQPEIKSRCQELLKEQEISRREIKGLISKATCLTRCLEVYGWTFYQRHGGGAWIKYFNLPYYLHISTYGRHKTRFVKNLVVQLEFKRREQSVYAFSYKPVYTLSLYVEFGGILYLCDCFVFGPLKAKCKIFFTLQKFIKDLPKVFDSVEMELFYDTSMRKRVQAVGDSVLKNEMIKVFKEACKKFN